MTCIRPWAPTWLCAKGLKPDSTAMTARIKVGSTLARRPVSKASATSALRGSGATPYFLLNQNATAACCLGSSWGLVAVARSIASGSKLTLAVGAWRSWSQPIRRTSLSVRISGCATKVMIANMTAKPRSAKPLCVISKKPWAMSFATVRMPLVMRVVAVIALPSLAGVASQVCQVGKSLQVPSFGLVRYQYPAASSRHVQRFEYAGFGSGAGNP